MARHNDISRAHALLEGEGWHLEYHPESVIKSHKPKSVKKKAIVKHKKDKRSCIHYNRSNKSCYKLKCTCMGSSDCSSYRD